MPKYPRPPDLVRTVTELGRRVTSLEARMSQTATGGSGGGLTPVWDTDVLWNGDMESGTTGWQVGFWNGTLYGILSTETDNPLDGQGSMRVDEYDGNSATGITWHPSNPNGQSANVDCWPTTAGDTWRMSALAQSTGPITLHLRVMLATDVDDIYGIADPNVIWMDTVALPLSPNTPTPLTGQITVPTGGPAPGWSFIGCHLQPDIPNLAHAYTWWADDVVLQKRLQ
jgi:hypothetical protein